MSAEFNLVRQIQDFARTASALPPELLKDLPWADAVLGGAGQAHIPELVALIFETNTSNIASQLAKIRNMSPSLTDYQSYAPVLQWLPLLAVMAHPSLDIRQTLLQRLLDKGYLPTFTFDQDSKKKIIGFLTQRLKQEKVAEILYRQYQEALSPLFAYYQDVESLNETGALGPARASLYQGADRRKHLSYLREAIQYRIQPGILRLKKLQEVKIPYFEKSDQDLLLRQSQQLLASEVPPLLLPEPQPPVPRVSYLPNTRPLFSDSLPVFMSKALSTQIQGQSLEAWIQSYANGDILPAKSGHRPWVVQNFLAREDGSYKEGDLEIRFVEDTDDLGLSVKGFEDRMRYAYETAKHELLKDPEKNARKIQNLNDKFVALGIQLYDPESGIDFNRVDINAIHQGSDASKIKEARANFDTVMKILEGMGKAFITGICELLGVSASELGKMEGQHATARSFPSVIIVYRRQNIFGEYELEIQTLRTLLQRTAVSTDRSGAPTGFRESGFGYWDQEQGGVNFIWRGDRGASKRPTSAPRKQEMSLATLDWVKTLESQATRASCRRLVTVYSALLSSSFLEIVRGRRENEAQMFNIGAKSGQLACETLNTNLNSQTIHRLISYSAGVNGGRVAYHVGLERKRIIQALKDIVGEAKDALPDFLKLKLEILNASGNLKPWKDINALLILPQKVCSTEEKFFLHLKSILWLVTNNHYLEDEYLYMLQAHMGNMIFQLNRLLEEQNSDLRFAHIKGCKSGKDRTSREDDLEKCLAEFVKLYGISPESYENLEEKEFNRQRFIYLQKRLYPHSSSRVFVAQNCPGTEEFVVGANLAGGLTRNVQEASFLTLGKGKGAKWTSFTSDTKFKPKKISSSLELQGEEPARIASKFSIHSEHFFAQEKLSPQQECRKQFSEVFSSKKFTIQEEGNLALGFTLRAIHKKTSESIERVQQKVKISYHSNRPSFAEIAKCIYHLRDYDLATHTVKVGKCSNLKAFSKALLAEARRLNQLGQVAPELKIEVVDSLLTQPSARPTSYLMH